MIDMESYQNILVTKTPILNTGNPEEKRAEILNYFQVSWELDDRLYDSLKGEEAFCMRADPLRHPIIFYIGHTATFFINKLLLAGLITERINPKFESIFAVGVDEMSWDDLNEKHYDWPSLQEVRDYRKQVKAMLENLIAELPLSMPINWDSPFWVIIMGIEHQRIHIETSSVLIRQLPIDQVQDNPLFKICEHSGNAPTNDLMKVKSGQVNLGKTKEDALYGWDNEFGKLSSDINAFSASKFLVSNEEFKAFVEDEGY
ncbi:MAG: 5-histidylcysteine sulfoxide synthase, partial [Ancylomarina sp.]